MKTRWYKNAVVYQIYPFSFMDSNNDGWGDTTSGILGLQRSGFRRCTNRRTTITGMTSVTIRPSMRSSARWRILTGSWKSAISGT